MGVWTWFGDVGGVGCEYVVRVCSRCGRVVCTRDVIEVCDRGSVGRFK